MIKGLIILILTSTSFAWAETEAQYFVARRDSSKADPRNPGVVGHTFNTASAGIIKTPYRCPEIVADISRYLVDAAAFEETVVYDYLFGCVPVSENESYVGVDLTVEPANEESIGYITEYVAKRNGEHVHKQLIQFENIASIEVSKSFSAQFEDPKTGRIEHEFSVEAYQGVNFPNFAQYKNHISQEAALFFQNPNIAEVITYLGKFLSTDESQLYRRNGMLKSNFLGTRNQRKLQLTNGSARAGIYAEGAIRDCGRFGQEFCLVEE